jgi:transcriptional regulator with XRE-family HTH domain
MRALEPDESVKNGPWFKQWLELRRFTDVEIADRLGVTTATIWNYKRSNEPLKHSILLALDAIDAADLQERLAYRSRLMGDPPPAGGGANGGANGSGRGG